MQTTTSSRTYAIDPAHSQVGFAIRHLGLTLVRGIFNGLTGTLSLGPEGEIPTAIEATIVAESLDTREGRRDGHVRGADFLDTATHPQITFRSGSVTGSGSTFTAIGDLTLHGTTKSVTLVGKVAGRTKDAWGNDRIGWSATTQINRKDFGINYSATVESGAAVLGDNVEIDLQIQAIPPKAP